MKLRCHSYHLAPLILLTACVPNRLRPSVLVTTTSGAPVPSATIAFVCPPLASAAGLTGDDGTATLILAKEAKECLLTIAKRGFHTQQEQVKDLSQPTRIQLEEVSQ